MKSQVIMEVTEYYCATEHYITCSNRKVQAFLRNFLPPSSMKELILPTNQTKFMSFDCNSLGHKQKG